MQTGYEPCAGVHLASYSMGTVSPATLIKPSEPEAHHTPPSLPQFHSKSVPYSPLLHMPSRPVHALHHSSAFHYCISLATVITCSVICNDKIRTVYTDTCLCLYHCYIHLSFQIEIMFKMNVLSVGSSNNTDQSHNNRMLTVSRHCAGHHCPSEVWKMQFPAVCHYWQLYTECPRRNVPDFGRVFLMLKYTDITQNTYVQSWTVTEIKARE